MIAALPGEFVQVLLGSVVVVGSVLLAGTSLLGVVRRHKAEERFLSELSDSMRKIYKQDQKVLQRAKKGELTEKEKENLRESISDALSKLDETPYKDSIEKALKQPSPRGRENYERKILADGARRALRESETPSATAEDAVTAKTQDPQKLGEEPRATQAQNSTEGGQSEDLEDDDLEEIGREVLRLIRRYAAQTEAHHRQTQARRERTED